MTRKEFARQYRRQQIAWHLGLFGPIFGFGFVLLAFKEWILEAPLRLVVIAGVCLAAFFCVVAIVVWRFVYKRFPGMLCPKCARRVTGNEYTHVTGLCHCGERIFDLLKTPPGHMFTPLECEAVAARGIKFNILFYKGFKWCALLSSLGFIALNACDFFHEMDSDPYTFATLAVWSAPSFFFMVFMCAVLAWTRETCPNCNSRVQSRQWLLATRICQRCGNMVLSPPKDDDNGPALSGEEWTARFKQERQVDKKSLVFFCLCSFLVLLSFSKIPGINATGRLAAFGVMSTVFFLRKKFIPPDPSRCPRCGSKVYPAFQQLLLDTGRCPSCGGTVVKG